MENLLKVIRSPRLLVLDKVLGLVEQPSAVFSHLISNLLRIKHFLYHLLPKQLAILDYVVECRVAIFLHKVKGVLGLGLVQKEEIRFKFWFQSDASRFTHLNFLQRLHLLLNSLLGLLTLLLVWNNSFLSVVKMLVKGTTKIQSRCVCSFLISLQ